MTKPQSIADTLRRLRARRDHVKPRPWSAVTVEHCPRCLRSRWHYMGRCCVCAGVFGDAS